MSKIDIILNYLLYCSKLPGILFGKMYLRKIVNESYVKKVKLYLTVGEKRHYAK